MNFDWFLRPEYHKLKKEIAKEYDTKDREDLHKLLTALIDEKGLSQDEIMQFYELMNSFIKKHVQHKVGSPCKISNTWGVIRKANDFPKYQLISNKYMDELDQLKARNKELEEQLNQKR